jgi:hypothetical protein
MECLPVETIPEGNLWTYELKLDGYRLIAAREWWSEGIRRNPVPVCRCTIKVELDTVRFGLWRHQHDPVTFGIRF